MPGPVVTAALRRDQLEPIPGALQQARQKAELGRTHWERVLRICEAMPDDRDLQVEKAYDALVALSDALIAANGYRRKATAGSHRVLLEVAVELLAPTHPDQAAALNVRREHLRRERNVVKYDRHGVVSVRERDRVLSALPPILAALEEAVATLAGMPLPGHRWLPPAG